MGKEETREHGSKLTAGGIEPIRLRPEPPGSHLPAAVTQRFRVVVFDFDGAVRHDHPEGLSAVRALVEQLCQAGAIVAILSGAGFASLDRRLSTFIRGPHKRNLVLVTDSGAEMWGFDGESRPMVLARRGATPEEARLLDESARAIHDEIAARTRLPLQLIADRDNRRRLDLIPLPQWADPPRSAVGTLYDVVDARLRGAGLVDGLREAYDLAHQVIHAKGLVASIACDVKHLDIELSTSGDAIRWVMGELLPPMGVAPSEVLIVGDEFGPVAGFPGNDAGMLTKEAEGAVFASIGQEPGGTPPGVVHLGGGPAGFLDLLASQVAVHARVRAAGQAEAARVVEAVEVTAAQVAPAPPSKVVPAPAKALVRPIGLPCREFADPAWLIRETGWNPAREHEIESMFTVANGYTGTRGSIPEGSMLSAPGTFLAGVFDLGPQAGAVPDLVVTPDWLHVKIEVDGERLELERGRILEHHRVLDLRQGVLFRDWRHEDSHGRITRVRAVRLASLADRHVLLQTVTLTPENYSGRVNLESGVNPWPEGEAESPVLVPVQQLGDARTPGNVLTLRVRSRATQVALAAAGRVESDEGVIAPCERDHGDDRFIERWHLDAVLGRTYRLDRVVSIYTSRDLAAPAPAAVKDLAQLLESGLDAGAARHIDAWREKWRSADIVIDGDEALQQATRFALYHLISSANPEDERVSIGARALTGRSYKGHVFWDTEIFMLPFYTFTDPRAARALLMYRYHTLDEARHKALSHGYRGALYPWEAADTGEETTPAYVMGPEGEIVQVLSGVEEQHISADVAYAVWQYWQASGDDAFLRDAGAEIVIETARFWASRGRMEDDERFHIRRIMGPDEYHETIDDNAFTNGMAAWNLERAVEAAALLEARWPDRFHELARRIELTPAELESFGRIAAAMTTGHDPQSGLFEQFAGYFQLEDIQLAEYAWRTVPMDVLLGRERIQASQVVKQPDVVMLLALLWDRFAPAVRLANFRYYEPRTGHGSSLSPSIHALVAGRLGDERTALRYLKQTAEIDLGNNMGNAAGGVHAAALGGLWQALAFGLAGISLGEGGELVVDPHLPSAWRGLEVPIEIRGRRLRVRAEDGLVTVELAADAVGPAQVRARRGPTMILQPGRRGSIRRQAGRWGEWQG